MSQGKTLLVVEDDDILGRRLCSAMELRGFSPSYAASIESALECIAKEKYSHSVLDLKLGARSGLDLIEPLRKSVEDCRIIVMTGYGDLPTAVSAIKAGATDYLPKPADADAIEKALLAPDGHRPEPPESITSVSDLRLEHIERVFFENHQNVSETARRLGMHRRTLQRILVRDGARASAQ